MLKLDTIVLEGSKIRLELLAEKHKDALFEAAQDESIWLFTGSNGFGHQFADYFDEALSAFNKGEQLPFIVRRLSDQKIIGSTRFYDIASNHKRLVIGYTWYIPSVWGSYVNPECKLLLLTHAFEQAGANRVGFHADVRNTRSRAAITKLGAFEEGILRQHMVVGNYIRDTVLFSVIKPDWPTIKKTLQQRLIRNLT